MTKRIYLDYQATTPLDPQVFAAMLPHWMESFGNPHSEGHPFGWEAREAVEVARSRVADFIGADDGEIVFVSGATESCNLALRGAASGSRGARREIITLATEHAAVLDTAHSLHELGFDVTILPVRPNGLLDLAVLESALSERTLLVSAMLVNNEIGVVQPLANISRLCRTVGAMLHSDATQAAGRIDIDVDQLGVDLLSLSAHKVYGPNGVGALYVRERPDLRLEPVLTGGRQERGLRPGTVPTPLVAGFGEACAIAARQLDGDTDRLSDMAGQLLAALQTDLPNLRTFGDLERRAPGSLNIGVPGILGERLVEAVSQEVAISTGAACATGSPEPSRVLLALGLEQDVAATGVRISLGRFTTLRKLTPLAPSCGTHSRP
ncbi:MAG: aminotransferase class V-fold PLP-dependent enzyme [Spirochaetaceae bacterium]|nr:aminotransferase class V-fold PLP-dependent enzyme [Spirochaetaceae bacterium]